MEDKKFQYADSKAQTKKVNRFLCISTAILYVLSYTVIIVSFLQGKRTAFYAIGSLLVMLTTVIIGFVTLKKDSGSLRLRYYMMVGICIVTAILVYAYVDYYMRFLAAMPFLGCILFFDTKFIRTAGLIVSAENIIITLLREYVWHTYDEEIFVPNLVAGIAVCVLMFLAYYITNVGKSFNEDSMSRIQHEANTQKEMMDSIVHIAERVRTGTNQAMSIVNELQSSAESVNRSVNDISESSISTAESIQNQSSMTQDIQENINEIVARAKKMVETAQESNALNQESAKKIKVLRQEAETLIAVNDQVANAMQHLTQNVENVKAITKTIFDISSQTNLLALNASIESARAGEAGRGFAVVADEIRTLSERTRQETENISSILDALAANTSETAKAIEQSLKSGSTQEEMIIDVSEQFATINTNIEALSADVTAIGQLINDLSNANTEIVNDITTLSAVTEEVTASAQQSAEMTEQNYLSAKEAKELLDDVLLVSHEMDKYIN